MMTRRFPWERVMELGLGQLRLSPAEFWRSTPREIAAAFRTPTMMPMGRGDLDTLMQLHPDRP